MKMIPKTFVHLVFKIIYIKFLSVFLHFYAIEAELNELWTNMAEKLGYSVKACIIYTKFFK